MKVSNNLRNQKRLINFQSKQNKPIMQLQIFKFQSPEEKLLSEIRTIEIDGEIWFVANDVASVLGYINTSKAISDHCKEKGITKRYPLHTTGGVQQVTLINEANVYRLIIKSRLERAERFEEWLFEEVIPSIRKKGYYGKIDRTQVPNFYLRYQLNFKKIDRNYFSVISELFVTLNAELEKFGYQIPDKGQDGKGLYPDLSVGKLFANYLKAKDSQFSKTYKTYKHSFSDGRQDVDARMYTLEALPVFRKFVYEEWIPKHAERYLGSKDPHFLEYLPKLLGKAE